MSDRGLLLTRDYELRLKTPFRLLPDTLDTDWPANYFTNQQTRTFSGHDRSGASWRGSVRLWSSSQIESAPWIPEPHIYILLEEQVQGVHTSASGAVTLINTHIEEEIYARAGVGIVGYLRDVSDQRQPLLHMRYNGLIGSTTSHNATLSITGLSDLPIGNGESTPWRIDGTAFGPADPRAFVEHEFTIQTTGGAPLNLAPGPGGAPALTISGADPQDFEISHGPRRSVLLPGERTTIGIRFAPKSPGLKHAAITVQDPTTPGLSSSFSVRGLGRSLEQSSAENDRSRRFDPPRVHEVPPPKSAVPAGQRADNSIPARTFGRVDLRMLFQPRHSPFGLP